MKSIFSSISHSIRVHYREKELLDNMLSQFYENFESDPINLQLVSEDKEFPIFVRQTIAAICAYALDKPSKAAVPAFIPKSLKFLASISFKHPIILDIVAANTNMDFLIPSLFENIIENNEVVERDSNFFFPALKFIAYLSCSKHFTITSVKASQQLIIVLSSLLTHPQLAAWCASILANIAYNTESFITYVKQSAVLKMLKTHLGSLVTSSDQCAMLAGVAASAVLFPQTVDHYTTLNVAIHALSENIPLQLTPHLASIIIIKAMKKVDCSEAFDSMIDSALTRDSFTSYEILNTLTILSENKVVCKDLSKIRDLVVFIIGTEEAFVTTACCRYLIACKTYIPDIFTAIDPDFKLFKKCLRKFIENINLACTEKIEALIVLLRCLIISKQLPDDIVDILQIQEENIFMQFMRRIQNNDSFLCVQIFLFIFQCSAQIEHWHIRLMKVIVDSQFTTLVAHVLYNSSNRSTTTDALKIITILTSCGNLLDDDFVTSFVFISKENARAIRSYEEQIIHEKTVADAAIRKANDERDNAFNVLETVKTQIKCEREDSRKKIESLNKIAADYENVVAICQKQKESMRALHRQNNDLDVKNRELEKTNHILSVESAFIKKKLAKHKDLKDRCKILQIKLNEYQRSNSELQVSLSHANDMLEKKKELIKKLQADNQEKEDIISGTQNANMQSQDAIKKLEKALEELRKDKEDMKQKIDSLKDALDKEQQKSDQLETTNQLLNDQIGKMAQNQVDLQTFQAKFVEKTNRLKNKLIDSERDRKKWETAARFANKVCIMKNIAVHDVYGSVYSEKNK